jgi:hypothetical protein
VPINSVAYLVYHKFVERCARIGQKSIDLRRFPIRDVLEKSVVVIVVELAVVEPYICERDSCLEISLIAVGDIHKVKGVCIVGT